MSRPIMLVLTVTAAGLMGYGVAQASQQTRQAPRQVEIMYAKCNLNGISAIRFRATYCSNDPAPGIARGLYKVGFERSVRGCGVAVTPTTANDFGNSKTATTSVSYKYEDERAVKVLMRDGNGNYANHSFYIVVTC